MEGARKRNQLGHIAKHRNNSGVVRMAVKSNGRTTSCETILGLVCDSSEIRIYSNTIGRGYDLIIGIFHTKGLVLMGSLRTATLS